MAGTTVPRRAFGRFLRTLRGDKALLMAGVHADTSKQTVMRLEEGLPTKLSTPQLERLLDFYEATAIERRDVLELWDEVRKLAKSTKALGVHKGWWQVYAGQYDPHFDHYMRLESGATHMISHQLVLMPGILQSPDYRRAIIRATVPDLSAVDTERRLELAARRQARLPGNDLNLNAYLSESVLRHQPGGPRVMHDQLHRLAELGERENVSIRVVPHSVGMHPGLVVQSFTLLEFPPTTSRLIEPPVIYTESQKGALYLDRGDVISRYKHAIMGIQQVALSEEATRELVLEIAKEYAA